MGYQKISAYLTGQNIPTPSAVRREKELAQGRHTNRPIAAEWSSSMVKDILDNDFYTGTFRLHKRARSTVHGKDKRVPKSGQYCFANHHPPVIDEITFQLVQQLKAERAKNGYKGSHGQWGPSCVPNPFGSCLCCSCCGHKLTPVERRTSGGIRKYYLCSTYNTKGKRGCARSHLIEEQTLMNDIENYLNMCCKAFAKELASIDPVSVASGPGRSKETEAEIQKELDTAKIQLQTLFLQKIKDISACPDNETLISESYSSIQENLTKQISLLETKLQRLQASAADVPSQKPFCTARDLFGRIIQNHMLNRKDIGILIERIEVDEDGMPEITLASSHPETVQKQADRLLNAGMHDILASALSLIKGETRGFTSAKYLSEKLSAMGHSISKTTVQPYIRYLTANGILKPEANKLKPYTILKTPEETGHFLDHSFKTGSFR